MGKACFSVMQVNAHKGSLAMSRNSPLHILILIHPTATGTHCRGFMPCSLIRTILQSQSSFQQTDGNSKTLICFRLEPCRVVSAKKKTGWCRAQAPLVLPMGCSLFQGSMPGALALQVSQAKHTQFIKPSFSLFHVSSKIIQQ